MIWVDNGTVDGITTFADRGIECLQEVLADIRTQAGGPREFLRDAQWESVAIERIMSGEERR
ncbi:hypothetical protein [Mangrovicoccus ximenensis]|uniref:hypothetical protein n=1 Tax=Mangrovicoccus ximenensis TaxID=1911570 RepID=UPI000D38A88D|nr:hypothetical protein [Mangrovicoccus ximenensis]